MNTCNVCCKPANFPYRRMVGGEIVEGCVAKIHDDHLPKPSNTWDWVAKADKSFKKSGLKRLAG